MIVYHITVRIFALAHSFHTGTFLQEVDVKMHVCAAVLGPQHNMYMCRWRLEHVHVLAGTQRHNEDQLI